MNTTHTNTKHPVHPEAGLREAGLDELIKDAFRVGPAPTRSREAFAAVLTLVLVGGLIAVLRPEALGVAVVAVGVVAYLAIRWVIGTRKWGQR